MDSSQRKAGRGRTITPMQKALVMRTKLASALLAAFFVVAVATTASAAEPDPKFYIFLYFGQSNMEGFPGVEE